MAKIPSDATADLEPKSQEPRLYLGMPGATLVAGTLALSLTLLQLALGGDVSAESMMGGATFFGLLAVLDPAGLTAMGVLNLILLSRFLLGAYAMKNLVAGEPVTAGLLAPEHTAAVMLMGFAGVWVASLVVRRFVRPMPMFAAAGDLSWLRTMVLLIVAGGLLSTVLLRFAAPGGDDATVGGAWGLAKEFVSFHTASLPLLMLYLWKSGARRWLTHPAVLALLLIYLLQGVLSSSKQGMAEPGVLYLLMALARYGWRHPVIWLGLPLALVSYQYFISPIAQYARNEGARDKNPREAAIAMADIVIGFASDTVYRDHILRAERAQVDPNQMQAAFLGGKLGAFARFAMVGEADRLVDATDRFGTTGMETISNSVLVAVPHFLYPNKPQTASGNFLGRYAVDLGEGDFGTQVSYGFMANAYNAYGMFSVFALSAASALLILGALAMSASGRAFRDPWSILAITTIHQGYVESSFSAAIGAFHQPVDAVVVYIMVTAIFLGSRKSKSSSVNNRLLDVQ
jgi:hypothetical protein